VCSFGTFEGCKDGRRQGLLHVLDVTLTSAVGIRPLSVLLDGRKSIAVVKVQKSSIERFKSYLRVRSYSQNGESWDGEKRVVRHFESYGVEGCMFEKVQKY
jgi:hypothetical protein